MGGDGWDGIEGEVVGGVDLHSFFFVTDGGSH